MNTNDEVSLYAQFYTFAQQFTYAAEDEVVEKIDAVLQDQVKSQQVKTFARTFDADTHHYTLQIQMNELSIENVWSTFRDIQQTIDFGVGMYTMKERNDDKYHYLLITLRENGEGLYCEVDFYFVIVMSCYIIAVRRYSMRENNELLLYSLIEKFTGQFTYGHEAGLDVDISVFLQKMKDIQVIKDFTMSFDRNTHHYKISVVHSEKAHLSNIHPIFLQFQAYIAFSSGGTLYAHKEISNGIRYLLALVWKEGTGFYCEIDFVGP